MPIYLFIITLGSCIYSWFIHYGHVSLSKHPQTELQKFPFISISITLWLQHSYTSANPKYDVYIVLIDVNNFYFCDRILGSGGSE